MSRVSADFSFHMFDVGSRGGDALSSIRRIDGSANFQSSCNFDEVVIQDVRAVKTCCDIILDSGLDATVIPIPVSMIWAGKASEDQFSFLRDAQGGRIATEGVRDICISLTTVDGKTVAIRDQAHVSSRVDTPLISYGKLLKHGCGIVPEVDGSYLVHSHSSGAKVHVSFKQNSLLVTGVVRMVEQMVRVIDVGVPCTWQNISNGWYRTRDGFPICASHGRNYVDVLKTQRLDEWPYRTTLGFGDNIGWQVIELRHSVFQLDERAAANNPPYQRLLTLLSKDIVSVADFGMVLTSTTAGSAADSSEPGATSDVAMPATTSGAEHGLGGAQRSLSPTMTVSSSNEGATQPRQARPIASTSVAIEPFADRMTIAGVDISRNSSIAVLKCHFLEVSQSGSKAKLWDRIVAAVDCGKILEEKQLADAALLEGSRVANPVQTVEQPGDEEV